MYKQPNIIYRPKWHFPIWGVINAAWGAYDGYQYAKKKNLSGWKKAGAIVGEAVLGTINPFKALKIAKKSKKIAKPKKIDKPGRTNIQRMEQGISPLGPDGKSINLHHMTQRNKSVIAEVTQTKNTKVIHINPNTIPSGIDRNKFNQWKRSY